ncbi:MAG: tetratricopeptide repeat protein [Pseudomonadota bacterium]
MRPVLLIAAVLCLLPNTVRALTAEELLRAGTTYAESGAASKAIPVLQRVLKLKGVPPEQQARAHLGLGISYAQLDKSDLTIQHLDQALALDPKLAKAYLVLGMSYDLAEQPAKALEVYRRGIAAVPGDGPLLHELGLTELMVGEVESAVTHLKAARRTRPEDADLMGDLGYAQLRAGLYNDAVTSLTDALAYGSGNPDLFTHLGDAYAGNGLPKKALDSYDRALDLDPAKVRARFHKGLLLAKKDDLTGAIACYRDVLRRAPDHQRARLALAASLRRVGGRSVEESERILRASVTEDPSFADGYVELARIAVGKKDLGQARSLLEQALERRADHAGARSLLREVLTAQGDQAALQQLDAPATPAPAPRKGPRSRGR